MSRMVSARIPDALFDQGCVRGLGAPSGCTSSLPCRSALPAFVLKAACAGSSRLTTMKAVW